MRSSIGLVAPQVAPWCLLFSLTRGAYQSSIVGGFFRSSSCCCFPWSCSCPTNDHEGICEDQLRLLAAKFLPKVDPPPSPPHLCLAPLSLLIRCGTPGVGRERPGAEIELGVCDGREGEPLADFVSSRVFVQSHGTMHSSGSWFAGRVLCGDVHRGSDVLSRG
jgi:hypothetical protein